jgi:hypothetical protein
MPVEGAIKIPCHCIDDAGGRSNKVVHVIAMTMQEEEAILHCEAKDKLVSDFMRH